MDSVNKQSQPMLEINNPKPLLEIEGKEKTEKTDLPGDLKISEDDNEFSRMGKLNILEWVRTNMPYEYEHGLIESVTPEKMTDENGNFEWKLIDVKQPKTSKDSPEETKTFLEIQTTWVIKTKEGKVRRPTQFLMTGVSWPTEDANQQLEAIKRATIAIDLYTHTMARPLYKKENELPEGFRFNDLVTMSKLSVGVYSTGLLKDKMKVEVATPGGQGGKAKAVSYELSELTNRIGVRVLNQSTIHRDQIDFNMINKQARHAIVKEASGREVNPEDRETYRAEEELDELYQQTIKEEISYNEEMQAILEDPKKLERLLTFMGKERENHIVDFNMVDGAIHSGPETRAGEKLAKYRENFLRNESGQSSIKSQQQLLGRYLDNKKDLNSINTDILKKEESIKNLQKKVDESQDERKKTVFTNQLETAKKELTDLHGERLRRQEIFEDTETSLISLIERMEDAHDFLSRKIQQYEHLALFIAAKAAGKPLYVKETEPPEEIDIYDITKVAENYSLEELLKEGSNNLSAAEHYFISTFLGSKGGWGAASRKGMVAELERMEKTIDKVNEKIGRQKPGEQIGALLEEVDE